MGHLVVLEHHTQSMFTEDSFGCFFLFFFPEELYGDFEDLETGDMHKGESGPETQVQLPGLTIRHWLLSMVRTFSGPC